MSITHSLLPRPYSTMHYITDGCDLSHSALVSSAAALSGGNYICFSDLRAEVMGLLLGIVVRGHFSLDGGDDDFCHFAQWVRADSADGQTRLAFGASQN